LAQPPRRLWRFLVATAFKGGDAASMYVEALRWRKRNGTDATRADLRAANPSFFTARATSLETPLLTEQDAAVFAARPRTFFTKSAGGGGELLLDRGGNLLFIEVPASADAAAVCALGADAFLASELRTQERGDETRREEWSGDERRGEARRGEERRRRGCRSRRLTAAGPDRVCTLLTSLASTSGGSCFSWSSTSSRNLLGTFSEPSRSCFSWSSTSSRRGRTGSCRRRTACAGHVRDLSATRCR